MPRSQYVPTLVDFESLMADKPIDYQFGQTGEKPQVLAMSFKSALGYRKHTRAKIKKRSLAKLI